MADFEQAGATERLRRVAILRDMQAKLKRSSAEALGVSAGASAAEVRSAFMALTKQYHPAKFARLDEATVKLANEVFLQLREAYETLSGNVSNAGGRRARTVPGPDEARPVEVAKKPEANRDARDVRAADSARRAHHEAASSAGPNPAVANPGSAGSAGSTLGANRPPATSRPAIEGVAAGRVPASSAMISRTPLGAAATPRRTPPSTAAASAPRPAPSIASSSHASASAPGRAPINSNSVVSSTGRPPPSSSGPSNSPSSSSASTGPTGSAARGAGGYAARGGLADRTPIPPSSTSGAPPAASGPASITTSASSSSSQAPTVGAAPGGPRIRFGTSGGPPTATADAPTVSPAELAKIRELMQQQKWPEARDALQILLLRTPADRTQLAQLAYVRAREALELGNLSEARRELVRALAIEPTLEPAKATLAEINSPINSPVPRR